MDEEILIILVYVRQHVSTCYRSVPRLWKFKVEGIFEENILGHSLGVNFE